MSSVQNTPSPIVNCILQKMNYHGKGLGLHKQGILKPIHVMVPPCSYGLGYTPQGKQFQDVGTSSMHPKSTTSHRKPYHIPKTYMAIPPPSSYKCQNHVTIHLPPSNLSPLLPTPKFPPSTLPPLLPTPKFPIIHKFPHIPNHDQQMHASSKQKDSTRHMGFKNKHLDASTYKAKNPKGPNALGYKCKESKSSTFKNLPKLIPSQAKCKTKMVWVPKQNFKSNEASTSQKSQTSSSIHKCHSIPKSQIPSTHKSKK